MFNPIRPMNLVTTRIGRRALATLIVAIGCSLVLPPSLALAMVWTQVAAKVAGDAMVDARFGSTVVLQGDLAFVGAPRHDSPDLQAGLVYVYRIDLGLGTFTEIARLAPTTGVKNDVFGASIAVQDDLVVVGATEYPGSSAGPGFAMVFERPAGGWSGVINESATLLASNRGGGDQFGVTVAIQDSLIAVGALGEDEVAGNAGAVYLFERPEGGWSGSINEVAKLIPTATGSNNTYLGRSLAISGDVILSGGSLATIDGLYQTGCVFVFEKPATGWSGSLTESARLRPADFGSSDRVGQSLAMHGDTVAVGAYLYEAPGLANVQHGAVFVFEKPGSGWAGTIHEVARLDMSDKSSQSKLGVAVDMDADRIVATSVAKEAAYVFDRPATGWSGVLTESSKLVPVDGGAHDFGSAVALDGANMLIGANFHDEALEDAGRVYLFIGDPISGIGGIAPSARAPKLVAQPNPFNPRTQITFELASTVEAALEIYDVRGQRVRSIERRRFQDGPHSLLFDGLDRDGRALSSGVYFARLESEEGWSATVKLTLVR